MKNQTGKYLKYAIGEIILVVIGILIALQINNWNESKKLKHEEIKLLNRLVEEIESNLASVDSTIKNTEDIVNMSGDYLKSGIPKDNFKESPRLILASLGYNTNKYDTSIINEILGTNSKSFISDENTLAQLRILKQAYDRSDKTQFYADEFWNRKVTDFFTESGLGLYFTNSDVSQEYSVDLVLDKTYYSLLGIMNGYQESLLMSRRDLREVLSHTLYSLRNQTSNL